MSLASGLFAQAPLVEGRADSRVRVLVYEDLQCPDCATLRRMMDEQLLPKYADRVAFEHKDFPLAKHAWARPASMAARHFQTVKPELGVEFRRRVMADLRTISPDTLAGYVATFARQHGADPDKAVASLKDEGLAKLVEADFREGVARGVAKTPTVFVDGQPFIERFTAEELMKALDAALK